MRCAWIAAIALMVTLCTLVAGAPSSETSIEASSEDIYVLRSIRDPAASTSDGCASSKTGFEPFPSDAERTFSFWSISSDPDGHVVNAKVRRVARLRACMGPTSERARQAFYAEIELNGMSFRGSGDCTALLLDFPESRLFPVRCQLLLSGLPPPYVGGLLTTNTMTSAAAFGGDTEPPGYTQASIATIRLWRKKQ
jgi:hypothetical protein